MYKKLLGSLLIGCFLLANVPSGLVSAQQADSCDRFTAATCTGACANNEGLRQNNPTNIEYNGNQMSTDPWIGASTVKTGRFLTFEEPEYGFRAAFINSQTHQNEQNAKTIRERVALWSPSSDNSQSALQGKISTISQTMGISPDTPFDINDPTLGQAFIKGLTISEVGAGHYTDQQIQNGYNLAFNYPQENVDDIKNALADSLENCSPVPEQEFKNYVDEPGYGTCRPLRPNQAFFDTVNKALSAVNNQSLQGEVRFSVTSGRHPDPNFDCAKTEPNSPSGRHAHGMGGDGTFKLDGTVITDTQLLAQIAFSLRGVDQNTSIGYSNPSQTITHVDFEPNPTNGFHGAWAYPTGSLVPPEIVNALGGGFTTPPAPTTPTAPGSAVTNMLSKITGSQNSGFGGIFSTVVDIFLGGNNANNRISEMIGSITNVFSGSSSNPSSGLSGIVANIFGRNDSDGIGSIFSSFLGGGGAGSSGIGSIFSNLLGGGGSSGGLLGGLFGGSGGSGGVLGSLFNGSSNGNSSSTGGLGSLFGGSGGLGSLFGGSGSGLFGGNSGGSSSGGLGSIVSGLAGSIGNIFSGLFSGSGMGLSDRHPLANTEYPKSEYNNADIYTYQPDTEDDETPSWRDLITNFNGNNDDVPNDTSLPPFTLEVSSYRADGAVVTNWKTDTITIGTGEELAFRWDAQGYDSCIPFIYPVNYDFSGDVFTIKRDTDTEQIDVRELTKTYVVRCQLGNASRSEEVAVTRQ